MYLNLQPGIRQGNVRAIEAAIKLLTRPGFTAMPRLSGVN
jgi:hypothetical protein